MYLVVGIYIAWTYVHLYPPPTQDNPSDDETIRWCKKATHLESLHRSPLRQIDTISKEGPFTSEMYQDATLVSALGNLFRTAAGPEELYYVDVGAGHPTYHSNTFALDKCYGWRGLCIEADPPKAALLKAERSCAVVETCAFIADAENVPFHVTTNTTTMMMSNGIAGLGSKTGEVKKMSGRSMATILDEHKVTHVDVMSLDVESAEPLVLGGIDWSRVKIDILVMDVSNRIAKEGEKLDGDGERMIDILEHQGFVPVLEFYPHEPTMSIHNCASMILGQSVREVFRAKDANRRQDVVFVDAKSRYYDPLVEWVHNAGCT